MPHRFNRRLLLTGLAGLTSFAAIPAFTRTRAQERAKGSANLAAGNAPLARRLADYIESMRFADLDGPTIERAKVHLLDSLGCGLSAFAEETVKSVRELAVAAGGNAATIIGTKQRTTLDWAAFANGAAIRADDINDGYTGTGHPSDNIAACLPVAEAEGSSGADSFSRWCWRTKSSAACSMVFGPARRTGIIPIARSPLPRWQQAN